MIESKCPDCGAPGFRNDWRMRAGQVNHIFLCSEPSCPRAINSWVVVEPYGRSMGEGNATSL
jgi:hypothetical protein